MKNEKLPRRTFFKITAAILSGGFIGLWGKILKTEIQKDKNNSLTIPLPNNKEVSFFNEIIVVNKNNKITVFSSHCTHLGCTIKTIEDNKLICPCHGSEFTLDGIPVKGPAIKPLKKHNFNIDNKSIKITIKS